MVADEQEHVGDAGRGELGELPVDERAPGDLHQRLRVHAAGDVGEAGAETAREDDRREHGYWATIVVVPS